MKYTILLLHILLTLNSCKTEGCTDSMAENCDQNADTDDGSCIIAGCTDPLSDSFNPNATKEDGTCEYLGCIQSDADNFCNSCNKDDGSCVFSSTGVIWWTEGRSYVYQNQGAANFRIYFDGVAVSSGYATAWNFQMPNCGLSTNREVDVDLGKVPEKSIFVHVENETNGDTLFEKTFNFQPGCFSVQI